MILTKEGRPVFEKLSEDLAKWTPEERMLTRKELREAFGISQSQVLAMRPYNARIH
jgi:hypothetical protein